jgi:hypothetical protein
MKTFLWLTGVVIGLVTAAWLMSSSFNEIRRGLNVCKPPQVCEAQAQFRQDWDRIQARPIH